MVNDHGQSELEDYFRDHGMEYDGFQTTSNSFLLKVFFFEAVGFCCQISHLVWSLDTFAAFRRASKQVRTERRQSVIAEPPGIVVYRDGRMMQCTSQWTNHHLHELNIPTFCWNTMFESCCSSQANKQIPHEIGDLRSALGFQATSIYYDTLEFRENRAKNIDPKVTTTLFSGHAWSTAWWRINADELSGTSHIFPYQHGQNGVCPNLRHPHNHECRHPWSNSPCLDFVVGEIPYFGQNQASDLLKNWSFHSHFWFVAVKILIPNGYSIFHSLAKARGTSLRRPWRTTRWEPYSPWKLGSIRFHSCSWMFCPKKWDFLRQTWWF